jgi:hypothetical protein
MYCYCKEEYLAGVDVKTIVFSDGGYYCENYVDENVHSSTGYLFFVTLGIVSVNIIIKAVLACNYYY